MPTSHLRLLEFAKVLAPDSQFSANTDPGNWKPGLRFRLLALFPLLLKAAAGMEWPEDCKSLSGSLWLSLCMCVFVILSSYFFHSIPISLSPFPISLYLKWIDNNIFFKVLGYFSSSSLLDLQCYDLYVTAILTRVRWNPLWFVFALPWWLVILSIVSYAYELSEFLLMSFLLKIDSCFFERQRYREKEKQR